MRVAIFTDSYPPDVTNGVAYSVQQQAQALAKNNNDVRVYTLGKGDYSYCDQYGVQVTVLRAPVIKPSFPTRFRLYIKHKKLLKSIISFKPDIVHSHSQFRMSYLGYIVAKKLKVPFIMTFHTFFSEFVKYHFDKGFDRGFLAIITRYRFQKKFFCKVIDFGSKGIYGLYKLADYLIVPSLEAKKYLIKEKVFDPRKISFIPHFIPSEVIEKFKNQVNGSPLSISLNNNEKIILHVGRLSKEKRVDVLIRSFATIKENNVKLIITSDGPERKKLEELVSELNLENKVIFTGFIPSEELNRLYNRADLFATAAIFDTFNLATAQAIAMNKPVVISNLNPQKEYIIDGYNGTVIDTDENEIENYAKAMKYWLKAKKSIENKNYLNAINEERNIIKLIELYRQVIREKKSRNRFTQSAKRKLANTINATFYLIITFFMYLSLKLSGQLIRG